MATTLTDKERSDWGLRPNEQKITWAHWRVQEVARRMAKILLAQWDVDDTMLANGDAILTAALSPVGARPIYHVRADLGYDGLHVVWRPELHAWAEVG